MGNRTFNVTISPNTSTNDRTGTLTFVGGGITRVSTITQRGVTPVLARDWSSRTSPAAGDTRSKEITSNITWTLTRSANSTWLMPDIGLGTFTGNRSFNIITAPNTSTAERVGTLTFTGGGITRVTTVTQRGAVVTRTVTFDSNGGTVSPTSRTVNYFTQLGTLPIPTRSGHTFAGWFNAVTGGLQFFPNTLINQNVTLFARWTVTPVLTATGSFRNIRATGSPTLAASVTSNTNWTLARQHHWITPSIPLGNHSGNREFTNNVAANPTTTERVGTLTIAGGGITRTLTFTQNGAATNQVHTVTFDSNAPRVANPQPRQVAHDQTLVTLPEVSRVDHRFLGWFINPTLQTQLHPNTRITANMTVRAQWNIMPRPQITAPNHDGAVIPHANFTLQWRSVPDSSYQVSVRNLTTDNLLLNNTPTQQTSLTLTANQLTPGHTFRTFIRAVERGGGETSSYERTFRVELSGDSVISPPTSHITRGTAAEYLAMGIGWPLGSSNRNELRNLNHISSPFGPRGSDVHMGIDIIDPSGSGRIVGTPVLAVARSRVSAITTTPSSHQGFHISIESNLTDPATGQPLVFYYMHLQALPARENGQLLSINDEVSHGEIIGRVGTTGTTSGSGHLHFEVSNSGQSWGPGTGWTRATRRINPIFFYPIHSFTGNTTLWNEVR